MQLQLHLAGFDLGKVQDIVDDREQGVAAVADDRCKFLLFGSRGVSSSSPLIPMIAFIGVRISWLIIARKSLFARFAASAASFAFLSSTSATFLSVMSRIVSIAPTEFPFESIKTEDVPSK